MIDVKSILDDLGIDYKEGGKNVAANDVNVDCPFCNAEKHLGISLNIGLVNCWVCEFSDFNKRPSLAKVLMETAGLPWYKIKEVMEDNGWEPYGYETEKTENRLANKCYLPKETYSFDKNTPQSKKALEYLKSRGFGRDTIEKYKLQLAGHGYYGNRIIIPIYFNGKLVSFTGRGFGGHTENRYKHSPLLMSSERIKNLLYNYDSAKRYKKIYILEGPTDIWRMGDDSVAVFRSALSRTQRNLILKMKVSDISIIYDPKATSRAYETAEALALFVPKIKVVRLTGERDVSDRTREEILHLESKTRLYRG